LPAYRCRQDAGGPRGYASLQNNPSEKTLVVRGHPMEIHLGQYWRLLRLYLRPQWPRAVALAVLLCAVIALELLSP